MLGLPLYVDECTTGSQCIVIRVVSWVTIVPEIPKPEEPKKQPIRVIHTYTQEEGNKINLANKVVGKNPEDNYSRTIKRPQSKSGR